MPIRPADWGPYGAPALSILYGESGTSKTTSAMRAHPTGYLFGPKGAFNPSVGTLGFALQPSQTRSCSNLWDALTLLTLAIGENVALPPERQRPAVVLDDMTLLTKNTILAMKDSGQFTSRKTGKPDVWAIYGELADLIARFCYLTRNAGMHCVITGHESDPFTDDDGKAWKGGLNVGSKNATKSFPYHGDLVIRSKAGPAPGVAGGAPSPEFYFPAHLECIPGGPYYEKDRFEQAPTRGPMNYGELLRLAGYRLERLPSFEWMDDQVSVIVEALSADSQTVASAEFDLKRREWTTKLLNAGVAIPAARWVMQDAIDRIDIVRRKRAEVLASLGVENGAGAYRIAKPAPPKTTGLGSIALAETKP